MPLAIRFVVAVGVGVAMLFFTFFLPGLWTDWLLSPMRLVHDFPLVAVAIAVAFGVCAWLSRVSLPAESIRGEDRWTLVISAGIWAGYAVYEFAMQGWEKTVVAPIRVDLLLIAPVLCAVTAVGLFALWSILEASCSTEIIP